MVIVRPLPPPLWTVPRFRGIPHQYMCYWWKVFPHEVSPLQISRSVRIHVTHAIKSDIRKTVSYSNPPVTPAIDHRNRLSTFFTPTGGIAAGKAKDVDVHALLTRAGFLRQAYSGIYHLLPLGLRVQDKIETLIDKHMRAVGASKLALSTISSEALWSKSGRLENSGQELIRFKDRKNNKYLLSPTHEEEITALVSSIVTSYRQLPLRLYQISRKYRDERRPRAGLLRGIEFTMQDLYTFDCDEETAISTYYNICKQYQILFEELGIPYLLVCAEADSGSMGGSLSHEFHYPSPTGEDVVIFCSSCNYAANEVCAKSAPPRPSKPLNPELAVFHGITKDRKTLINVFYPKHHEPATGQRIQDVEKHRGRCEHEDAINLNEVNPHRVKELVPDYDPSVHSPLELFWQHFTKYDPTISVNPKSTADPNAPQTEGYSSIINIYDYRLPFLSDLDSFAIHSQQGTNVAVFKDIPTAVIGNLTDPDVELIDIVKICEGDSCPKCFSGSLALTKAIELGHTFHLSSRYSRPLNALVSCPTEEDERKSVPMSMGCHGIGVSRMIAAIAEGFRDERGLMWPRVIAPFEVCIIGTKGEGMEGVYDILTSKNVDGDGIKTGTPLRTLDVVLDDRDKSLVWKLNDADLIGYPVLLVLGRRWKSEGKVEIQCRPKGWNGENESNIVEVSQIRRIVNELLSDL